jgi:hypothetical protein
MKTYWVITVKDPGDPVAGISRYESRFEFDDLQEAFECALSAHRAGFRILTAKVSTTGANGPEHGSHGVSGRTHDQVGR